MTITLNRALNANDIRNVILSVSEGSLLRDYFICPWSLELYLHGHLVLRKSTCKHEGAVFSRNDLELASLATCCKSREKVSLVEELSVALETFFITVLPANAKKTESTSRRISFFRLPFSILIKKGAIATSA